MKFFSLPYHLKIVLPLLIIFFKLDAQAQKLKEVKESGTYKMRIEKTMSEAEAERLCIERARIDAIERHSDKPLFKEMLLTSRINLQANKQRVQIFSVIFLNQWLMVSGFKI